ncbi:MAG: hypothetical protein ACTHMD_08435 [Flavisolibacter sp.]
MKRNNKKETNDPAPDLNTHEKPREEWLRTKSTKNSEPGLKPGSSEKPKEVWIDEKDKKEK